MKPAQIEYETVLVGEVPCVRILGFKNISNDEKLPDGYMSKAPSFALMAGGSKGKDDNGNRWDGTEHKPWQVPAGNPIIITNLLEKHGIPGLENPDPIIYVGDILREDTFQALLVWMRRAGARLGKIRKAEKEALSNKETVTI